MKDQLKSHIVESYMYGEGTITDDQDLFESGVLDSMAFMKLLGFVEQNFGIQLDMSEVTTENFASLDKMVATIEEKKD